MNIVCHTPESDCLTVIVNHLSLGFGILMLFKNKRGNSYVSLLCDGSEDKSCVAQASGGTETGSPRESEPVPGAVSFSPCLFHFFLPRVLTSVCGSSRLFIKWYLRHQFPYHLKNPEPSPSDLAFYGRNCSFL